MKKRKAEIVAFNEGVNYPSDLTGSGNFSYWQTQYMPTFLQLIDLIKSREIDQYTVVLIKKDEEEEWNKPNVHIYDEE